MTQSISLRPIARVTVLAVCLSGLGAVGTAEAQLRRPVEVRDLAKACWARDRGRCGAAFMQGWDWFADAVLSTVQPQPQKPGVLWDGTFPYPEAENLLNLMGVVSLTDATRNVCSQLPDKLRADPQLLLRMFCNAERELLTAGPDQWKSEKEQLAMIRKTLAGCLPPGSSNTQSCSGP